jgi:hypothetical protein
LFAVSTIGNPTNGHRSDLSTGLDRFSFRLVSDQSLTGIGVVNVPGKSRGYKPAHEARGERRWRQMIGTPCPLSSITRSFPLVVEGGHILGGCAMFVTIKSMRRQSLAAPFDLGDDPARLRPTSHADDKASMLP